MKIVYNYIAIFSLLLTLFACSNPLKEKVSFDVRVDERHLVDGDITIKAGMPLVFYFDGDPNFITYYSGEPGAEYAKRDQIESSKDDITSQLTFDIHALYGDCKGTLSILMSTDFSGLSRNFDTDKENVESHNWTDITELCNLPEKVGVNNKVSVSVPLDEYLGEKITVAMHYHPTYTGTGAQSKWIFTDLKIVNTDKKTQIPSEFGATNMGFLPLYLTLPKGVTNHYEFNTTSTDKEGMWNFSKMVDNKTFDVHSSGKGTTIEQNSWLISQALKTNARMPDKGLSIKNMQVYLDDYTHIYTTPGEYEATFIATNSNIDYNSRIVKTLKIIVTD